MSAMADEPRLYINLNEAAAIRREATRVRELARQLEARDHIPAAIRSLVVTFNKTTGETYVDVYQKMAQEVR